MPIYDYRCRECGKVAEVFLRSADDRSIRCPDCGSSNLERLLGVPHDSNGFTQPRQHLLWPRRALRYSALLLGRGMPQGQGLTAQRK